MSPHRVLCGAALLGIVAFHPGEAFALDASEALAAAQQTVAGQQGAAALVRSAMSRARRHERSAAQRLADADLLLGSKDYNRAIVAYSQIVEKYPSNQPVYAEAQFGLGEAYFRSGQYSSARRAFARIAEERRSGRPETFRPKALARLADIAIRVRELASLDELIKQMNAVSSSSVEAVLQYARGRLLLAKQDLSGAKSALQAVPASSPYHHQARYLIGVAAMREGRAALEAKTEEARAQPKSKRGAYATAIDAFAQVTRLPPDTPQHKHVVDLAWMAVGRLLYETDRWTGAVDAYNHIDRASPEFGKALYELAAVYVQMGDTHRAQRALELLAVVDPASTDAAEANLLRGDLELRSGQFEKARTTFESVRSSFDPMRQRIDAFLASTSDPAVYYDRLVEERLDALSESGDIPPLAVSWAREAENGPEAFAVVDEVVQTRRLLKDSQALVSRLFAMMSAPNRVRAFPELRAGQQTALSGINSLTRARALIGEGLDDVERSGLSGEIATVAAERRALQARVRQLPIAPSDFQRRDEQAMRRWNTVSQGVQQMTLQVDTLQALVNGLRRVVRDSAARGVVRDQTSTQRFEEELRANERDVDTYRKRLAELRDHVDVGKATTGYDDASLFQDDVLRRRFREVLTREVSLAAAGAAGGDAVGFAARAAPILTGADQIERELATALREINERVDGKTAEIMQTVRAEQAQLAEFAVRLDVLDQEARLVVGEVAMRNFALVRDRLRAIVLRADVGITEEAWEAREEQTLRVRNLQTERARAERLLNEELREVLDDAVD
ncbi:MAG: tetratricopeptide repeat protein [Polyangiaceae bacterium]|jgi:tetratricopeptide (TPR) repeat protein|nr:tetratricopeptide repeat protein [Polyangiaceae bacterium]